MFAALRIFKDQKRQNENKGLVRSPYNYFFRWRKSLISNSSSIADEQPWLTFEAIDFLKKHLNKEDAVFEYGGGGSTLFFLNIAGEVATVEHNKEWFDILTKKVQEKKAANWKGNFVPGENGDLVGTPDSSDPSHYSSADNESKGLNYKNYASAIDSFTDNHFTCVVVDGRSRPSCMMHSLSKIKPGGWLVLDNSDRSYYTLKAEKLLDGKFEKVIDSVGPSPYSRAFTKTTIWKKIK